MPMSREFRASINKIIRERKAKADADFDKEYYGGGNHKACWNWGFSKNPVKKTKGKT